ncbi:MAG TPA: resolvase [bacterium]|nr:resolvase [bacterium]
MSGNGYVFLSVDPGRDKCGLAVMDSEGRVIEKKVVSTDCLESEAYEIADRNPGISRITVGTGTGGNEVAERISGIDNLPDRIERVSEQFTTLKARKLYERENPRHWLLRIFPRWFFESPMLDAHAAVVIGLRYLGKEESI